MQQLTILLLAITTKVCIVSAYEGSHTQPQNTNENLMLRHSVGLFFANRDQFHIRKALRF